MANYQGNSIVDYLASTGQANDFASRTKLATSKGISGYTGSAQQNTQLLNLLRGNSSTQTLGGYNPTPPSTTFNGSDISTTKSGYTVPTTPISNTNVLTASNDAITSEIKTEANSTPSVTTTAETPKTLKDKANSYLEKYLGNNANQANEIEKIQKDEQIYEKKKKAQALSTELDVMEKKFRGNIKNIRQDPGSISASAAKAKIAKEEMDYEDRRANVSLSYKIAADDYNTTAQIVNDKVQALKDQNAQELEAYKLFIDSINNDLTESERLEAEVQKSIKIESAKTIEDAYKSALQAGVDNKANAGYFNAIDSAKQTGNPSKIQQVVSQYGYYSIDDQYKLVKIGDGGETTSFTKTQLNTGANAAGLTLTEFKDLQPDVQNFFINTNDSQRKAMISLIDSANKGNEKDEDGNLITVDSVKTLIDESTLTQGVKDYWKNKLNTPSNSSSNFQWWNPLTWF